jgi:formylglycine-generating enzyme required for sulfatase activity
MNDTDTEALPQIDGYKITRRLGRGGMADVYLAMQVSLSRPVAIKVLASERSVGEDTATRFEQEARMIARLDHPNIVGIFDVGLTAQGRLYYVMPYLPNGDLSTRDLRDDEAAVVSIIRALVHALGYAHQHGIVHRDVKPENVLFDKLDRPLLADFGIALATRHFERVTREGSTMGSAGYMSPEQARGQDLDGRADLYSLGVVAYEMLSGDLPYHGPDTLAVALAHVEQPIPRLPPQRRRWQPFIDKAMAKSPDQRFQTAEQVEAALDAIAGQIGDAPELAYATRALPVLVAPGKGGHGRSFVLAAIVIGLVGMAMIGYAVLQWRRSAPAVATAAALATPTSAPATDIDVVVPASTLPDANAAAAPAATVPVEAAPEPAKPPEPPPKPHLADLAAGAMLRDRGGPELAFVPAKASSGGQAFDGPAFALGRYEVTRREYAAFASASGRNASRCREPHSPLSLLRKLSWREPGFDQDDSHPVVCVSWADANAYAEWLGKRLHARYRLPTAAEWIHASRWNSSAQPGCAQSNLADEKNSLLHRDDETACSDGFAHTAPVGKFKPNRLGIHDLVGNVSEWTLDCKGGGKGDCEDHMFIGSSWRDDSDRAPDAEDDAGSDVGYTTIGFRLLRELDDDNLPASIK